MAHYVYILYTEKFDKFYIGQTNDVSDRLKRHNNGTEKATKPFIPWKMIWFTSKEVRSEAMILEKKLKNLSKERIKLFIKKYS